MYKDKNVIWIISYHKFTSTDIYSFAVIYL